MTLECLAFLWNSTTNNATAGIKRVYSTFSFRLEKNKISFVV